MLKAILFDCDGTLIDSLDANWLFLNTILDKYGYAKISNEKFKDRYKHMPITLSLKEEVPTLTAHEIVEMTNAVHQNYENGVNLNLGVKETLEILKDKYILAVVTSRGDSVDGVLKHFKIYSYFKAVVHRGHYLNAKPHPEPLEKALEKLNIAAKEAVYVGDSEADAVAAKHAGMKSIILYDNAIDADYKTNSFKNIIKIIERLKS